MTPSADNTIIELCYWQWKSSHVLPNYIPMDGTKQPTWKLSLHRTLLCRHTGSVAVLSGPFWHRTRAPRSEQRATYSSMLWQKVTHALISKLYLLIRDKDCFRTAKKEVTHLLSLLPALISAWLRMKE